MLKAYVLIVLALNQSHKSPGSSSYSYPHPTVHMQEFASEKACLFAGNVILRRSGDMHRHLNVVCVPEGESK